MRSNAFSMNRACYKNAVEDFNVCFWINSRENDYIKNAPSSSSPWTTSWTRNVTFYLFLNVRFEGTFLCLVASWLLWPQVRQKKMFAKNSIFFLQRSCSWIFLLWLLIASLLWLDNFLVWNYFSSRLFCFICKIIPMTFGNPVFKNVIK